LLKQNKKMQNKKMGTNLNCQQKNLQDLAFLMLDVHGIQRALLNQNKKQKILEKFTMMATEFL